MQTNLLSRKPTTPTPMKSPRQRSRGPIFKVVLGLVAIFLVIAGIKALQIFSMVSAGKKMVMPPMTVTSATVQKANWAPELTAVGSISPVQGAMLGAELAGTVREIGFQSGTLVKKDQVLVKLDAAAEEAQLRSAKAEAELAQHDLERAQDLARRKVISKAELDLAESKFAQKKAAFDNIQSIIDKKQIRAPFDGIAGIRAVNPGQMVKSGDPLVSLQGLDRVYVDFSMPQQQIGDLKEGLPVKVTTDAIPDHEFEGKLTAVNSVVDEVTRNVSLQATLDNADGKLRGGMFARVRVLLPEQRPVLFVPMTAVSSAPYGDSVFVIENKKDEKTGKEALTLREQIIRTGEKRGDFVAVTKGLKEGEQVVSLGVFKLRNGTSVIIDNKLAPHPEEAPKPANT
ncbi:MAG: efflux RND transporter periplasmic adaptor subunit [Verrucomicrobiota bacterium]